MTGDRSLGIGAFTKSLTEGGEVRIEFAKRPAIGARDPLLALQCREIAPCRCLGDSELLTKLADRDVSALQKELCQP